MKTQALQNIKFVYQKEITQEEVRAKLAALSQDGKQTQVKALITETEMGVKKLSDVPAENYADLLKKAEELRRLNIHYSPRPAHIDG